MILRDPDLETTYNALRDVEPRRAAELAYALAVLCKKARDYGCMRRYRDESIALFKECNITTLEGSEPIYEAINGVMMPSLIHEGVVAARLPDIFPLNGPLDYSEKLANSPEEEVEK